MALKPFTSLFHHRIVAVLLVPPARFLREALGHVHSDVANDVSDMRRGDAGLGSGC